MERQNVSTHLRQTKSINSLLMVMRRVKLVRVPATTNNITEGLVNLILADGWSARRINVIGIYSVKFKVYRPSKMKRGIADIICCIMGRYVAIEIKKGEDVQSTFQKEYQQEVLDAGGVYVVVENYEAARQWYYDFTTNPPPIQWKQRA